MKHNLIVSQKLLRRKGIIRKQNVYQVSSDPTENLSSSQKWLLPHHYYGYLIIIFYTVLQVANCGIIDSLLYHKYRPMIAAIDPLNSSSSSLFQHFQVQGGRSANVEYQSPLNRIMELIGHHSAPVIVLTQSSKESGQQQIAAPKLGANEDASVQHWSFLGASNEQPFQLSRQNLAQVESPSLEQVYLPSPSQSVSEQPLTLLPSQFNLNPSNNLYHSLSAPIHYGLPIDQQQRQQQQQPQIEPQPIFLASYVPEVHSPTTKPSSSIRQQLQWSQVTQPINHQQETTSVKSTSTQVAQQPTSIPTRETLTDQQQTSNQQQVPFVKTNSSSTTGIDESESEGSEQDHSQQQEQPKQSARSNDTEDNDIEEPRSAVVKQVQTNKDEEYDEPSSGSSNYEEKFDSDTMDEPTRSNPSAQSSSHVVSGLVKAGLNDDCLQCICRASSGCDHLVGCITRGAEEKYCGPFQITEEYWQRAGSPGDASNEFNAFEDCANDMDCAVETISKYMQKYRKDCDGDGLHTCLDYVRLHKLKPDECDDNERLENSFDAYWAKFQTCSDGYNRSRNAEAEEI